MDGKLYLLCIIFKFEARLLGPFRCDKSCRVTVVPTNEVSADAAVWSPGDMIISIVIQMSDHFFLPSACFGSPLPAALPVELSATKEPRALHSVIPPVTTQLGQCAGDI